MFGYVRPLKGEMKVREFEQYKAAYCGLCHSLKSKYGFAARFCVNYDLTFLSILLSDAQRPEYEYKRCLSCAMRKNRCCAENAAQERAAACSVILCWWKLADMAADGGPFQKLKAAGGKLFLRRAYRKAELALPQFASEVRSRLGELDALEAEKSVSLDATADKFAALLRAAAPDGAEGARSRALGELLYHIGRWIYIVDAADDVKKDMEKGEYNPIAARFGLQTPDLDAEQKHYLATTLKHSASLAAAALELLDETGWSGILRNIVYLGMPWTAEQVLEGKFSRKTDRRPK